MHDTSPIPYTLPAALLSTLPTSTDAAPDSGSVAPTPPDDSLAPPDFPLPPPDLIPPAETVTAVMTPHAKASMLHGLETHLWPREKMGREGAESLSNQELLAVLFGRGQRGKDVLTLAGEVTLYLERVTELPTLPDLCKIHGIGHGKACQILAALEMSRRFLMRRHRIRIRKAADALPHLAALRGRRQECFAVITLDGSHQVIRAHEITVGLANQSQVHPRETFACALEDRAVGILAAHNHPSGSLDPSAEDLVSTRRLAEAGRLLGIPLLDHIIVTAEGFTSLRERFPDYFAGARGW